MKLINSYIIREHILPFFYALFVIMFILLMNFLVNYINELFGKGLSFLTIVRLIFFNLSWMLALAVPMATLVAVLMAYGRFSADNEITILKSSGISVFNIIRPSLYVGIFLTILMIYFSDQILPESNHQASLMFRSVRQKKPTLNLNENIFYTLDKYTIVVEKIERPLAEEWLSLNAMLGPEYHGQKEMDRLRYLTIYDRSDPVKDVTITAEEGYMVYSSARKALIFTLFDGEFHELNTSGYSDYRRSMFKRQVVYVPAENFEYEEEKQDGRGDREMTIAMMKERVASFEGQVKSQNNKIKQYTDEVFQLVDSFMVYQRTDSPVEFAQVKISPVQKKNALQKAIRKVQRREQQFKTINSITNSNEKNINKYMVEIHKKISIPFACIVFVLVGAPLGVMARKGGMGVAIGISILFFLMYWVFLIGGENLADRKFLSPAFAMWAPNIFVGIGGLYLTWRAVKETTFIPWDRMFRFLKRLIMKGGTRK
ncbi:MAG: LptF/LptG family permease [Calditrichaceae bacterium]|nr:LptF/LptG family permease [Calditrichaceae bacterium]RQV92145.1 MAG: YjgP/YjgQ family permease [Calditrichota bacterium]